MSAPDLALPDDVEALKAMVVAMAEKAALLEERNLHLELVNKSADERIARLTAIVKMLERARFGSRSERLRTGALSEEQYALVFDEIETGWRPSKRRWTSLRAARKRSARRVLAKALRPISNGSRWSSSPKRLLAAKRWKRS
ncbi:hypothetical protein [Mesorhizobium muleiense]|uniref:IS66 family transposase n=1 Tax=Mesorhizobium muleiense TaxID=1004279 RepID=UPI002E353BC8|nr:hypothetical protein [Mesorhizobium muleiense]